MDTTRKSLARPLILPPRSLQWGEQSIIEPSVQDGDSMLIAHAKAVFETEAEVHRAADQLTS